MRQTTPYSRNSRQHGRNHTGTCTELERRMRARMSVQCRRFGTTIVRPNMLPIVKFPRYNVYMFRIVMLYLSWTTDQYPCPYNILLDKLPVLHTFGPVSGFLAMSVLWLSHVTWLISLVLTARAVHPSAYRHTK